MLYTYTIVYLLDLLQVNTVSFLAQPQRQHTHSGEASAFADQLHKLQDASQEPSMHLISRPVVCCGTCGPLPALCLFFCLLSHLQ